jgi:hypothetical protein
MTHRLDGIDGRTPGPASTPPLGDAARERVRAGLVGDVASVVGGMSPGGPVEVNLPALRRARSHPGTVGLPDPAFAWKPAFARRSLGLAAVRACAGGHFRGPAEAVAPLAAEAVDEWRRTGRRTFHWEPWFAGLGAGARSVVLAEAVTWATPLWASADWTALGERAVIGPADDRWSCPGPRTVWLKARCEARVDPLPTPVRGTGDGPAAPAAGSALVVVSGGAPCGGWADDLGFLGLVAAVRPSDRSVPARVVGLWPEAGLRRTIEIDEARLVSAADRVVTTLALVVRDGSPDRVAVPA